MSRAALIGLAAVGVLIALVLLVFFNPWTGFLRGRLEQANANTETATDTAVGLQEGAAAQADVEKAATHVYLTVQNATEATHDLEVEARAAPDGATPLDPERADRLRGHDQFLLGLRDGGGADGGPGRPTEGGDA